MAGSRSHPDTMMSSAQRTDTSVRHFSIKASLTEFCRRREDSMIAVSKVCP